MWASKYIVGCHLFSSLLLLFISYFLLNFLFVLLFLPFCLYDLNIPYITSVCLYDLNIPYITSVCLLLVTPVPHTQILVLYVYIITQYFIHCLPYFIWLHNLLF